MKRLRKAAEKILPKQEAPQERKESFDLWGSLKLTRLRKDVQNGNKAHQGRSEGLEQNIPSIERTTRLKHTLQKIKSDSDLPYLGDERNLDEGRGVKLKGGIKKRGKKPSPHLMKQAHNGSSKKALNRHPVAAFDNSTAPLSPMSPNLGSTFTLDEDDELVESALTTLEQMNGKTRPNVSILKPKKRLPPTPPPKDEMAVVAELSSLLQHQNGGRANEIIRQQKQLNGKNKPAADERSANAKKPLEIESILMPSASYMRKKKNENLNDRRNREEDYHNDSDESFDTFISKYPLKSKPKPKFHY